MPKVKQKIKVVHFITSIDKTSGGTTTYMQLLAEKIATDVEITIVTAISPNPVKIDGVNIEFFDMTLPKVVQFRFKIGKFLDKLKPDIVHINGIWELHNTIIQNSAQRRKIPVIISPHGMLEPWIVNRHKRKKDLALALYQRRSITKATCLHATAYSEYENIRDLGFKTKMAIIENGIKAANIEIKDSWKKTNTILFLSRVNPKKGIEHLIDAISLFPDELKNYKVKVAGEGEQDYIDSLKKRAKEKKVEAQFEFCGGVYGQDKWNLFREADVFALPTYSENFGIVIPEALACGTPVITTIGAPWNDLLDYKCGWWTDIGPEPLAEALLDFVEKTEKELELMGRNGHRMINEKYTVDSMGRKMVELYHTVLQKV